MSCLFANTSTALFLISGSFAIACGVASPVERKSDTRAAVRSHYAPFCQRGASSEADLAAG